jgi:hypothetical protein
MQIQYKNGLSCGLEPLKLELRSRDDLIHRLRQEILILQEKRDLVLTEVNLYFYFIVKLIELFFL